MKLTYVYIAEITMNSNAARAYNSSMKIAFLGGERCGFGDEKKGV